jgi:dTDP-4-dehydrorhamnose 3,5-epimerase
MTLSVDAEAFYLVDEFYGPEQERIIRWNDPRFAIEWPAEPVVISDKDRNAPDFEPGHHLGEGAGTLA